MNSNAWPFPVVYINNVRHSTEEINVRCLTCNERLSEYEATMKNMATGDYVDMCSTCLKCINNEIKTISRPDLQHESDEAGTELALYNSIETNYKDNYYE